MKVTEIDYGSLPVPKNKDPKKYTPLERRIELLEIINQAGHPKLVNQAELGERYGKSQSQISQDIKILAESIVKLNKPTIHLITETIYDKTIKALMSEKNYIEAIKVVESWNNWLFKTGKLDKAPETHVLADATNSQIFKKKLEEWFPDDEFKEEEREKPKGKAKKVHKNP